jgi:hypothetical protein
MHDPGADSLGRKNLLEAEGGQNSSHIEPPTSCVFVCSYANEYK